MLTNLLLKGWLLAALLCSTTLAEFQTFNFVGNLASSSFEHKVTLNDPIVNGQDTVTFRYTVNRNSWLAIGVSPDGTMINGEVVIGKPSEGTVRKYKITGYNGALITEMDQQTLINTSLEQSGGKTVMTFTKLLSEAGEISINGNGPNKIIAAFGSGNNFGFHLGYGGVNQTFKPSTSAPTVAPVTAPVVPLPAPSTTVAPAPTNAPVLATPAPSVPTTAPVPATPAPTFVPTTLSPTPAPEVGFRQVQLTGLLQDATFHYRVNRNDVTVNGQDTITIEYSCSGNVWVGVGVSEFGVMVPAKTVIGFVESEEALLYSMMARTLEGVVPLPPEEQNLVEPQVSFANGRTTMRYTVPVFQDTTVTSPTQAANEVLEIHADGRNNNFIGACGANQNWSPHLKFGSFGVMVEEGETEAPTSASPMAAPTDPPDGAEVLELTGDLEGSTLAYQLNFDDPNTGGKDSITVTYTAPVNGWVSVGASESGLMVGSDVVIGIPTTGEVKKYILNSKSGDLSGIAVMPDEKQTLVDASITQANGRTTLIYTKILVEDGEIPINASGDTIFIAAHGISNTLGFHSARGSFSLSGKVIERDNSLWVLHGWLAAIAWGVCCPLAILAALFRRFVPGEGTWYQIHRFFNGLVILLTIASVIVAILALHGETPVRLSANHFSVDFVDGHRLIGLIVLVAAIGQGVNGALRPHNVSPKPHESTSNDQPSSEPDQKSGTRKIWEVLHRLLGVGLLGLSWYQIQLGIYWYHEIFNDGESESTLTIFLAVIGVLGGLIFIGVAMKVSMG